MVEVMMRGQTRPNLRLEDDLDWIGDIFPLSDWQICPSGIVGIYALWNSVSDRFYVGASMCANGLRARIQAHKRMISIGNVRGRFCGDPTLRDLAAWNFMILEYDHYGESHSWGDKEAFWIKELSAFESGYNSSSSGANRGRMVADVSRARTSVSSLRLWKSDEYRRKHAKIMADICSDPEYRANMSLVKQGYIFSVEHCRNISEGKRRSWAEKKALVT